MDTLTPTPKYEAYKDSGEQWMAEVPEHWEVKKLKHIFYEKKHTFNPKLNCGAISFGKVVTKDDEKIPFSTKASYQEVLKDEFLINPLNLNYDLISLRIALSRIDVVVSAGYIVLKDKEKIVRDYYKYLLHRYDVAYMKLLGSGVRQTINFGHIANSLLVLPPTEEQTAIANHLDRKTAQIDQAIAIKEKQIALLKERKQILIQNAVTRGLDPNVPMKDSGVEWIGEIPEHWALKKNRWICSSVRDGTHNPPPAVDGEHRLLSVRNIVDGQFITRTDDRTMTPSAFQVLQRSYHLETGDVVVALVGGTTGKSAVVNIDCSNISVQRSIGILRPIHAEVLPEFLNFAIQAPYCQRKIWEIAIKYAAQPGIYLDDLANLKIVCPPLAEQEKLLSYLHGIDAQFKKGTELILKEIDMLTEYRATLINSAVTGKIKVA